MNESAVLKLKTRGNGHMLDITPACAAFLSDAGARQGILNVSVVGSTAAIGTIEFEPGLQKDLPAFLDKVLPRGRYEHNETWSDDNGHSHLRSTLLGTSHSFPVMEGRLRLGTWQQIFLADFDTRGRERELALVFLGE